METRNLISKVMWIVLSLLCFTLISATNHTDKFTIWGDALTAPEDLITDQRTTQGYGEAIEDLSIVPAGPSIISDVAWVAPDVTGRVQLEVFAESRNRQGPVVQITVVDEFSLACGEQIYDERPFIAVLHDGARKYSVATEEARSTDQVEANMVQEQPQEAFQPTEDGPSGPFRVEDNVMSIQDSWSNRADENQNNLYYADKDYTGLDGLRFSDQSIFTGSPGYFLRT